MPKQVSLRRTLTQKFVETVDLRIRKISESSVFLLIFGNLLCGQCLVSFLRPLLLYKPMYGAYIIICVISLEMMYYGVFIFTGLSEIARTSSQATVSTVLYKIKLKWSIFGNKLPTPGWLSLLNLVTQWGGCGQEVWEPHPGGVLWDNLLPVSVLEVMITTGTALSLETRG